MAAFESFVNLELPKRLGVQTLPDSGNEVSGTIPYHTGIGLTISGTDIHPDNVLFVSPTHPLRDYDNLPDALEAANQLSKDFSYKTIKIIMDSGDYTIDRQITLQSGASALTSIVVQGYSPHTTHEGKYPSGDSVVASVRIIIDQTTTSPVFSLSYISLEFRDVMFQSIPTGGNFTPADWAIFQGGGGTSVSFQNCHIRCIDVNFGVPTHHLQLVKGTGGAFRFIIHRCYIYWMPFFSGDASVTRYLINLNQATHSYLIGTQNVFNIAMSSLNLNTDVFGFADLCNSSNDNIPYYVFTDNFVEGYMGSSFGTIFNFIYTNTNKQVIGKTLIKDNNIVFGPNDSATPTGTIRFLHVDSQANDAEIITSTNTFYSKENSTGTKVDYIPYIVGSGDTIFSAYDTFTGISESDIVSGAGDFEYNLNANLSQYTPTTSGDWNTIPDTFQEAFDELAETTAPITSGWTGTFTNGDSNTVTVVNGVITDVS